MHRYAKRALVGLAIVALVFGALFAFQRRLIYFPSAGPVVSAPGGRDVTLITADGVRLTAWHFPVPGARAAVLVAPGNAGDRSVRLPLARALNARGLSVLLLEYRGYGGNPGRPSESGLAWDVRAAREYLEDERVIYFGESLGAAVVAELATEVPPVGMVLRSPFTRLADVGRYHYPYLPVRALLLDRFPVVDYVAKVRVPVTVVYGGADTVVPPEQSRAVAVAAQGKAVEVPGADHNDSVLLDGPQVIDAIVSMA